jgi:hypothetical protein
VTSAEQLAALDAAGATSDDTIAALRMHAVSASSDAVAALRADARVASVEADRSRGAEADPSDSLYPDQWALRRIGWDQVFGTSIGGSAIVAILDTGVDGSQPELAGKLVAGTSLLGTSATIDPNGHGTAMAGIIAAGTDNASGIAGVGYDGVSIMPVTVLGPDGLGRDSDVIEGLVWAADHGADVALMAFSATGYSSALQASVDYAWSKGVVLVAATGNDGSSSAAFPAGDRGVVGVSNTDQSDTLNASSNYGADTFLAAPGTDIVTIVPGGGTTSVTGTSASAAHVAAAAALLRAADGSLSNGAIVGRLARTADAVGTVAQTGNGRLNLARAFADTSTEAVKPAGAAPVGDGGPFVGPYAAAGNGVVRITVRDSVTTAVIAGATVICTAGCNGSGNSGITNASGIAQFTVNYPGNSATVTLQASATGYTPNSAAVLVTNSNGSANPATATIFLTPANTAPTANAQSVTTDEDVAMLITLTGSDAQQCELTFSIETAPLHGTLSLITNQACAGGTPNSDGAQITYTPAPNYSGPDSITFKVNDGTTDSTSETVTIAVTAVNDAPVNHLPGGQSTAEDTALVFSSGDANQISVTDVDAGASPVKISLSATNGSLTLSGVASLVFTTGDGTADGAMVFSGTLAAVNAALNGLSYQPILDFNGSASLSIASDDQGANGSGGALTDSDSLTINVRSVNDAPVITNVSPSPASISEGDSTTVTVSFTDSDSGDGHTCTFAWGDGSSPATVVAGATSCSASHAYVDDNPTGTAADSYTVNVTVTDDGTTDGAPDPMNDVDSTSVTVSNLAPVVTIDGGPTSVNEGDAASHYTYSWTDPGDDTWTRTTSCGATGVKSNDAFDTTLKTGSFDCAWADDVGLAGSSSDVETVSVTVADDDSGTDAKTRDVTVNNVAPADLTASLSDDDIDENDATTLSGSFTDPGALDVHTVTIDWGDGSSDTVVTLAIGARTYSASHTYLDDDGDDTYAVAITVNDDDAGSDTASASVAVHNVAPSLDTASPTSPINENNSSTLAGTFTDPGTLDTFTLVVDWADGVTASYPVGTSRTFSVSHQYLDDNPTGTAGDTYVISVSVSDDDTGSASASTSVTVNNVAPSVGPVSVSFNPVTHVATATATFTDPGTLDTHVASTVAWNVVGSSPAVTIVEPAGSTPGSVTGTVVLGTGCYPVLSATISVTDDDLGMTSQSGSLSGPADAYTVAFRPPIKDGERNLVKYNNVVPVKVVINSSCAPGTTVTSPELYVTLSPGSGGEIIDDVNVVVESVSSADTGQKMRNADGGYIYNLTTKGLSITSDYTIRIRLGGATLADPVVLDGVIRPKK